MALVLGVEQIEKLRRKRARRSSRVGGLQDAERQLKRSMQELWKRVLFPTSERLQAAAKAGASPEAMAGMIEDALNKAEFQYDVASKDVVLLWKNSLDRDTRRALLDALRNSLGVDVDAILDTPEMQDALALGSMEAANLIKTIPQEYLGGVAQAVVDNFTGKPLPEGRSLLQQIRVLGGQTQRRSQLIARDQTKKLNASINQVRQDSLGIKTYIWRTVKDRRVVGNPSGIDPVGNKAHGNHWVMEGVHCRWDDPTVHSKDTGKTWLKRTAGMPKNHPGQDINCRCHAEPVINIDSIIKNAQEA